MGRLKPIGALASSSVNADITRWVQQPSGDLRRELSRAPGLRTRPTVRSRRPLEASAWTDRPRVQDHRLVAVHEQLSRDNSRSRILPNSPARSTLRMDCMTRRFVSSGSRHSFSQRARFLLPALHPGIRLAGRMATASKRRHRYRGVRDRRVRPAKTASPLSVDLRRPCGAPNRWRFSPCRRAMRRPWLTPEAIGRRLRACPGQRRCV